MAYTASEKGLRFLMSNHRQLPDGRWVIAKPLPGPFRWRLHDAWLVLIGKAEALLFEGQ